MRLHKTAYELARSQVNTPTDIVQVFWNVTHRYRTRLGRVLDLGAGDGRFAVGGLYTNYSGIEIDSKRIPMTNLPKSAKIAYGCAFKFAGSSYDACIGNPPYVRHHDLDCKWRNRIASGIEEATGVAPNRKGNLYLYFMFLALLKSRKNGLVSAIIPYEWVSRPSAKPLRQYISQNGWSVDTYRFSESIFDGVLTTASIVVVDKRCRSGEWKFFRVERDGRVSPCRTQTGTRHKVLAYEGRGDVWAMRGMSPGTQKVFTLTEGERIHAGLAMEDVLPCVTSLRAAPSELSILTKAAFQKWYVGAGVKCWLIRSHEDVLSKRLTAYLESVSEEARTTATCSSRDPWYRYPMFETPRLLMASGFTGRGPKVLVNAVGAKGVGSACGIYATRSVSVMRLRAHLADIDFGARVVPQAKQFKKIEIRQMNAVLNAYVQSESGHDDSA